MSKSEKAFKKLAKKIRKDGAASPVGQRGAVVRIDPEELAKSVREIQKSFALVSGSFALENRQFNPEQSIMGFYRVAMETLMDAIALAYQRYKVNPTHSYARALRDLIGQANELVVSVSALRTNDAIAQYICDRIINPSFKSMVFDLSSLLFDVKRRFVRLNKEDQEELHQDIDNVLRDYSTVMQKHYDKIRSQVEEHFRDVHK